MGEFRQFVLDWLERRGWSQARLAAASEINQSLVSKHLTEDPNRRVRPSPENLERYAPVLDVDFVDLMKMCGYLPGEAASSNADDLESDVAARTQELLNAVRGAPKVFWPTIIRATFDQAIGGARNMVDLLKDAEESRTEDIAPDGSANEGPKSRGITASRRRQRPINPRHEALVDSFRDTLTALVTAS